MIRVIVVDDQKLMRDGLKTILGLEDNIEVVGTAADGAQALEVAQATRPDLVLMDIRMPGVDGVQGARLIREQLPETKVLMLTTFNDSELILDALEEGASGYLLKDMPTEVIVQAIMTVCAGGIVLPPESTAQVVAEWKRAREHAVQEGRDQLVSAAPPYLEALTEREHDVLQLLGQGMNNKEIGETLVITEGTVKNHVSNIIAKLRLRDRTQAAIYAVRHGIASFS
ncbi:DNA-binding response regulator [Tumebacillus avium]|uniref:DNA-binding response regulator n=1 Tax=Tumebacillus avium TaxID=1903704 RepID=A0A1Y0II60_9BACL|nr:response regulator transcription factor [Tumebacillus avium]ARU60191.1 DNA-binding response regulator [Tumebacillus avium]